MYGVASKESTTSSLSFIESGINLLVPQSLHRSLSFEGISSSDINPFSRSYEFTVEQRHR